MLIESIRPIDQLREVLKNPDCIGPENAYWVFSHLGHKIWENMTVTVPGLYDNEFPKTYGHYHSASNQIEIYKLLSGHGIFLLQKKHVENEKLIYDLVDEVYLIGAEPGDEIKVTPEFGHSWSNVGDTPLITMDNWRAGHVPQDYEPIKKQQGMAFYLVSNGKEIDLAPNPKYRNHPKPKWLTAKEFMKLSG